MIMNTPEQSTEQEMQMLIDKLNKASDAYYNGKDEQMSDYEWDHLFDRLKQLEQLTGIILPGSPTHKVSSDSIEGAKEAHEYPALSLAKTKLPADLVKWADNRPIWMSWKLDGLTLVVTYDNGKLTKVVTRGNGHIGTNITHLAPAINGIPARIPSKGHTVIRGECVISYADFNNFNIESNEEYANPRNLASGSLTLKDISEVKQRHLTWIPFTLVHTDDEINSWGKRMDWIKQNGMSPVEHLLIEHPDLEHVQKAIDLFTEKVTHKQQPYPVDGLVIAYDDFAYSQTGSVTGHHATRAGYAFKWQDESVVTELDHIEWSCAASTISPVAVFNPVELEGTTVKRASLCNISECKRLNIRGKGSVIKVIKANKIIPKVIEVIKPEGSLEIPVQCPVCHAPTRTVVSPVSGTITLHCTNEECPAKQLKKFARFVSKDGLNIEGFSEQSLDQFVNKGWISSFPDIYLLKNHIDEIRVLDGWGDKSAENLLHSLQQAETVDATHLLYGLCIPMVGKDACKKLLEVYSFEELVHLASTTSDELVFQDINGIGPETSMQVVQWFRKSKNLHQVEQLLLFLHVNHTKSTVTNGLCQGLTFVITGNVHHYKNREELKAYIESQGGKVTGSVTQKTSYLINNDVTSTSGKNKKAHELGTPIISEDDFIEKFS